MGLCSWASCLKKQDNSHKQGLVFACPTPSWHHLGSSPGLDTLRTLVPRVSYPSTFCPPHPCGESPSTLFLSPLPYIVHPWLPCLGWDMNLQFSAFHQAWWLTSVNPRRLKQEDQEVQSQPGLPGLPQKQNKRKKNLPEKPSSLLGSPSPDLQPPAVSPWGVLLSFTPRAWLSLPVPDLWWHCLPTNCIFKT